MTTAPALARAISTGGSAIMLVAALASCGSGPSGRPASSTLANSSQQKVNVTESANGTSVTVSPGADVIVTLHSTYWQFAPVSAPQVLIPSAPEVHGAPPSDPGVPGSGKGTVRETYHARAVGTAVIVGSRTICGEALLCAPDQRSYRLTVVVR